MIQQRASPPEVKKNINKRILLAKEASTSSDAVFKTSDFFTLVKDFAAGHGALRSSDLLRSTLIQIRKDQEPLISDLNYPESVKTLIRSEFARISRTIEEEKEEYFDLNKHQMRSDFRILCFGRVPVGYEHMETSGVPRSYLFRDGLSQAVRFLKMLSACGGFKPYYQLHMSHGIPPSHFLFKVNHQTQIKQFTNIAECLAMNPNVRGVVMGSWWFDPQLESISPHLTFLRTFPVDRGAYLFRAGLHTKEQAIANSPLRQKLRDSGKYTPNTYFLVWSRKSLLHWANTQEG